MQVPFLSFSRMMSIAIKQFINQVLYARLRLFQQVSHQGDDEQCQKDKE